MPAVSALSCFPLLAACTLASVRVETALPEPRSAGLLSASPLSLSCVRLPEVQRGVGGGSVAAPRHTQPNTWCLLYLPRLLSDFGSCVTLTSQADAGPLLCVHPAEAQGHSWLCHSIPLSFWYVGCVGVSAQRGELEAMRWKCPAQQSAGGASLEYPF